MTQDVFLKLQQEIPTLADPDDLGGWLYRVTTNRCLNRLQHERLVESTPLKWLLPAPTPPETPEAVLSMRSELRQAMAVVKSLPPKERVAFSMHYLDDKEQREIGLVLGLSKGYVSKLIKRAEVRVRAKGLRCNHE